MGKKEDDRVCGVKPFQTGKDDPFIANCIGHDIGYEEGGSVEQQIATDRAFYNQMWAKALKNPLLIPRAIGYTLAVSFIGRWIWKYKK